MNQQKRTKTDSKQIIDFLNKTGFILEMEVAEFLKQNGYNIQVNKFFFDYDENKKREIDIIATKTVEQIRIIYVIECKQSANLDWIFVCSDKKPSRYYMFNKYFPEMNYEKSIYKTGIFDHLRCLDHNIPLAQNSVIRSYDGKQNNSREIYECLMKLPKAVVGILEEEKSSKDERTIVVPVAVFSSQMFVAEYESNLKVKEVKSVQFGTELDTDGYTYHFNYNNALMFDSGLKNDEKKNSPVAKISRKLGSRYLIEFVTKSGLKDFIKDFEERVSKIDLSLWPIETSKNNNQNDF